MIKTTFLKTRVLFFFISLLFIISCNKPYERRLSFSFPEETWLRFETISYRIPVMIKKPKKVNLELELVYNGDCILRTLEINAILSEIGGSERILPLKVKLREKSGVMSGRKIGKLFHINIPLFKEVTLDNDLHYILTLENLSSKYSNPGFIKADLIIKKN